MGYCDVCQSAGSVTRYGFCEICGTGHATEAETLLMDMAAALNEESLSSISATA